MAFPYDQTQAENLIDGQLTPNDITHKGLLNAVRAVPREAFVPESFKHAAYVDDEIPLGEGRVLIEPLLQAKLIQALDPQPHETVMVIAGATGYLSALLARFVARVEMVEENPALAYAATDAFKALGIANVTVAQNALTHGAPAAGPYDAIVIEGAVQVIPEQITAQLKEGGRLLVCENAQLKAGQSAGLARAKYYEKREGVLSARVLFDTSVALLPGFEAPRVFTFN